MCFKTSWCLLCVLPQCFIPRPFISFDTFSVSVSHYDSGFSFKLLIMHTSGGLTRIAIVYVHLSVWLANETCLCTLASYTLMDSSPWQYICLKWSSKLCVLSSNLNPWLMRLKCLKEVWLPIDFKFVKIIHRKQSRYIKIECFLIGFSILLA